jgi:cysteine desulfurase
MDMRTIYCDHNSTTRTDPRVVAAMEQATIEAFGNPSSGHRFGQQARAVLDRARSDIARYIGAKPSEIILTATGSESDNLAIFGSLHSPDARGRHLVTVSTEHHAITHSADWAERHGFKVTILPVDRQGRLDPRDFAQALTSETQIASVMLANNEIGTIHPIAQLASLARERGVIFHTDAVQALGKIPVNVNDLNVDLLSLAAHKFYGPKGVGILYVRSGTRLASIIHGGGQETGRRPGTENIPGAVGTAEAMKIIAEDPQEASRVGAMAIDLRHRLADGLDDLEFFGDPDDRLPNTVGVGFGGVDGESLSIALDLRGICVSTGSACMTGAAKPSHVLQAMGVPERYLRGSIRFSFGRENAPSDSAIIADAVIADVERLRKMAPSAV